MEGIVVSHVDDLLMGGSPVAIASLEALGGELGFGSLERGSLCTAANASHNMLTTPSPLT